MLSLRRHGNVSQHRGRIGHSAWAVRACGPQILRRPICRLYSAIKSRRELFQSVFVGELTEIGLVCILAAVINTLGDGVPAGGMGRETLSVHVVVQM